MSKKRIKKDIFDEVQNKWIQGEIINNEYITFKGWSDKWNILLKDIPSHNIKKAFTYTKRFRPKVGDIVEIKIKNIDEKDIFDFVQIDYNSKKRNKNYYKYLIQSKKNIWTYGLVINKSGTFISVLYIYFNIICILKIKRDSDIICEKNTHHFHEYNIFYDIFSRLSTNYDYIKNIKKIFLNNLKKEENIHSYLQFDFVLELIINNIHFFDDEDQKISFLKFILMNKKFEIKCYFELAHLYMNKNYNKKIIFRYLCLSGHTNIAVKYIQNKMKLEKNFNDPIDILYDILYDI